jgi:hypothetical protein
MLQRRYKGDSPKGWFITSPAFDDTMLSNDDALADFDLASDFERFPRRKSNLTGEMRMMAGGREGAEAALPPSPPTSSAPLAATSDINNAAGSLEATTLEEAPTSGSDTEVSSSSSSSSSDGTVTIPAAVVEGINGPSMDEQAKKKAAKEKAKRDMAEAKYKASYAKFFPAGKIP